MKLLCNSAGPYSFPFSLEGEGKRNAALRAVAKN